MEPMTWVYLAMMLAATASNRMAARKTANERAKVLQMGQEQRERQQKRAEEAAKATTEELVGTKDNEAERAAELEAAYATPEATTESGLDVPAALLSTYAPTGSTATVQESNRLGRESRAFTDQQNAARAKLAAFGDLMVGNQIASRRNAQDIAQAATANENWVNWVMPAQMNHAMNAGRDWGTAADVLTLAAAVMGPHALGKKPAAGTTKGTLDQMSGVPQEWAGKDLFGMGQGQRAFGSNYGYVRPY